MINWTAAIPRLSQTFLPFLTSIMSFKTKALLSMHLYRIVDCPPQLENLAHHKYSFSRFIHLYDNFVFPPIQNKIIKTIGVHKHAHWCRTQIQFTCNENPLSRPISYVYQTFSNEWIRPCYNSCMSSAIVWKQWLFPTKTAQFVYWRHNGRVDLGRSE